MTAKLTIAPHGNLFVTLELDYDAAEYVAGVLRDEWARRDDHGALEVAEDLEAVIEQIDRRIARKETEAEWD